MKLARCALVLAIVLCSAGCAVDDTFPTAMVTTMRPKVIASPRAQDSIVPGRSTRGDVQATLGETLVLYFDSGYEVWVYRLPDNGPRFARSDKAWRPSPGELVILFGPSDVVLKTRVRPAS